MRLTLRTLLAYLDEVLEPADAQDIGKKIEESELAANIVHRTRDVMRRLRLGAPKLGGRGMGLDPNTVSEYLDNTLADDRVADFEKVCLESDVHLAEVASCHQILALVLDEPAEVDPGSREKMYALIDRATAAKPVPAPAPAPAPMPAAARVAARPVAGGAPAKTAKSRRKKPEVPGYLREEDEPRSWKAVAAVGLLAIGFVVVLLMAIPGSWLSRQLGLSDSPPVGQQVAQTDDANAEKAKAAAAANDAALQQPESVSVPERPAKSVVEPGAVEPPLPNVPLAKPAVETPTPQVVKPAETSTPPPAKPAEAPKPVDTAATKPLEPVVKPSVPPKPEPPKPAQAPAEALGRLISNNQVLVRLDPKSGTWQRLPAQQTLFAADRLISLPAFRSTMSLSSGVTIELLGGSSAILEPAGADGVPGLYLEFGRAVVLTAGKPDTRLRVHVGERQAVVSFDDSATTMALEVRPVRPEGSDPEAQDPQLIIELYAASGKLTWREIPDGKPEEVTAPTRVSLGAKGVKGTELPEWITDDRLTSSQKIGAEFVAADLAVDKPDRSTMFGLRELADHRRAEVRHLAVQCLAVLGDFDPLVAALNQNDPAQKTVWDDQVSELRAAIARGPATAARVRQAFEKQRGEMGPVLYRMLWGYTAADIKAGADLKLVEALDHNDMDFRSLAIWNLKNLTGLPTLSYLPHMTADARRAAVQKWKQRQASGQIVVKPDVE